MDIFSLLFCIVPVFCTFGIGGVTTVLALYWAVTKVREGEEETTKNTIKLENQKEIK